MEQRWAVHSESTGLPLWLRKDTKREYKKETYLNHDGNSNDKYHYLVSHVEKTTTPHIKPKHHLLTLTLTITRPLRSKLEIIDIIYTEYQTFKI
jgi:hypothetical protein